MFGENFNNTITNLSLFLDHNGPEIGFWSGLGLMLGGAVWGVYKACKRVPEIKDEYRIASKDIAVKRAVSTLTEAELDVQKKQIKAKRNSDYVKAFAGPVLMEAAGVAIEVLTHIEVNHRMETLSGELVATTAAYSAYRKRTADLIGEEKERALFYGKDLKEMVVEDKDAEGNVIGEHTEYYLEDNDQKPAVNPCVYEFSYETTDLCEEFDCMHEFNLATLHKRQESWNKILQESPAVWLNDILRALGMEEETLASRRLGWLNKKWYNTPGDGYIDFRVTPVRYTNSEGQERWKYMLNFNCDGDIEAIMLNQQGLFGTAQLRIDRKE